MNSNESVESPTGTKHQGNATIKDFGLVFVLCSVDTDGFFF